MTALAESFRPWTGRESLLVDVEGHGREDIGAIDVSRTVGWFTSIYPVRLSLKSGARLDASLQSVKNQLRQIPDKGIGYGLLRDQMHLEALRRLKFSSTILGSSIRWSRDRDCFHSRRSRWACGIIPKTGGRT